MTNIIVGIVVILLGVLAGWYFLGGKPQVPTQETSNTTSPAMNATPTVPAVSASDLYKYTEENITTNPTSTAGGVEKGGVGVGTPTLQQNTISLGDTGFTPVNLTVRVGTVVTFVNNSTKAMWVASAVHPTHQLLPGFDQLKSVGKGGTYSYTFAKVGTWKYHNHVDASATGSVEVTQ